MKIFKGRKYAKNKEQKLKKRVIKLQKKNVIPSLASILIGEGKESSLYLSLKKKAAARIGAKAKIVKIENKAEKEEIIEIISKLNSDNNIHGVMIQLPLPKRFSKQENDSILDSIDRKKDVDGLRKNSDYVAPAVKAVIRVLQEGFNFISTNSKIVVVGSRGFIGSKIYEVLSSIGYDVVGVDIETKNLKTKTLKADIVISATGKEGIIKRGFIKEGAIIIDVGFPKGDVEKEAYKSAIFSSQVPGGIGPVTIVELLENLVDAADR